MLSGCGFFHSFLKRPFHKRLPQMGVCLLFYLWVGGGRQSSPMGQPFVLDKMCSQNCLLLLTVSDSGALTCVALWGRDGSEPCCPSEVTSLKCAWMNRRMDGFLIILFSSAVSLLSFCCYWFSWYRRIKNPRASDKMCYYRAVSPALFAFLFWIRSFPSCLSRPGPLDLLSLSATQITRIQACGIRLRKQTIG